jgi:RNA polymerase sporulation-specific sigma factor
MLNLLTLLSRLLHVMLGIGTPNAFPPPLEAQEEEKAFLLALEGDGAAREKLIVHNLRLVSHIVRKYYSSAKNQEDLVSVGTLGLIKAVDSFDVRHGARFATYAAKCIQNEILMSFRQQKKLQGEVSMSEAIDFDRDGNPLTYEDVISTDENMADELDSRLMGERAMHYVRKCLCERERQVIALRYGLGGRDALTQRETAQLLGISRSYVSRIEKAALEKLAAAFGIAKG